MIIYKLIHVYKAVIHTYKLMEFSGNCSDHTAPELYDFQFENMQQPLQVMNAIECTVNTVVLGCRYR